VITHNWPTRISRTFIVCESVVVKVESQSEALIKHETVGL